MKVEYTCSLPMVTCYRQIPYCNPGNTTIQNNIRTINEFKSLTLPVPLSCHDQELKKATEVLGFSVVLGNRNFRMDIEVNVLVSNFYSR